MRHIAFGILFQCSFKSSHGVRVLSKKLLQRKITGSDVVFNPINIFNPAFFSFGISSAKNFYGMAQISHAKRKIVKPEKCPLLIGRLNKKMNRKFLLQGSNYNF